MLLISKISKLAFALCNTHIARIEAQKTDLVMTRYLPGIEVIKGIDKIVYYDF